MEQGKRNEPPNKCIALMGLLAVYEGKLSEAFAKKSSAKAPEDCCCTLIGSTKSVDIEFMTAHIRSVWLEGIRQLTEGAGVNVRWHNSSNPPPPDDNQLVSGSNGQGASSDGSETAHISLRCRDLIQLNRSVCLLFSFSVCRTFAVFICRP